MRVEGSHITLTRPQPIEIEVSIYLDYFELERALAPFTRMNYRFTLNISNDLANNTFDRREADLEGRSTAWSAIPITWLKVGFLTAS